MVFGIGANGAVTVRSTSITSFCGKLRVFLVSGASDPPWGETKPPPVEGGQ
jgi:hypothetical protein